MSELFMPPEEGIPAQAGPAPAPVPPELQAAMGGGPGGADVAMPGAGPPGAGPGAGLPPELAALLGGGAEEPPEDVEPASLDAALEHFRLGVQMLQELQVASGDDMEMSDLLDTMGPVQKMLAGRQKKDIMATANG